MRVEGGREKDRERVRDILKKREKRASDREKEEGYSRFFVCYK